MNGCLATLSYIQMNTSIQSDYIILLMKCTIKHFIYFSPGSLHTLPDLGFPLGIDVIFHVANHTDVHVTPNCYYDNS